MTSNNFEKDSKEETIFDYRFKWFIEGVVIWFIIGIFLFLLHGKIKYNHKFDDIFFTPIGLIIFGFGTIIFQRYILGKKINQKITQNNLDRTNMFIKPVVTFFFVSIIIGFLILTISPFFNMNDGLGVILIAVIISPMIGFVAGLIHFFWLFSKKNT